RWCRWPWPGCWRTPSSPRRSSAPAAPISSTTRSPRPTSASVTTSRRGWTTSRASTAGATTFAEGDGVKRDGRTRGRAAEATAAAKRACGDSRGHVMGAPADEEDGNTGGLRDVDPLGPRQDQRAIDNANVAMVVTGEAVLRALVHSPNLRWYL